MLALHFAVMNDNDELVKMLCLHNINVDQQDFNGQTPLFYSIMYRAYKSLKIIINFKPNLNIQE